MKKRNKLLIAVSVLAGLWKIYQRLRWAMCKPHFPGKVVFISGGSSGIGEALAKRMV